MMAVNLLELTKECITKETGLKISDLTQERTSDVQVAMLGVLPALIGGIMNKASTPGGMQELIGLINLNNEAYVLNNLEEIFDDPSRSKEFVSNGLSLLPILLDLDLKTVTDAVAASSGLKSYSVSTLLSVCAPIVLSVVAKNVKEKGTRSVEPARLTGVLAAQKEYISRYLPADLHALWDFRALENYNKSLIRNPLSETELEGKPASKGTKALLWIIVLVLLAGLVWGYQQFNKKEETVVVEDSPVQTEASGRKDLASAKQASGGGLVTRQLPKNLELKIAQHGTEFKLITFIQDSTGTIDKNLWFDFDNIQFESNGTKLTKESREQIDNMAKILKAYPDVNIKIGGYTDNTGDAAANLTLSKKRADAVRQGIVSKGIKFSRVQSEGYGMEHPVASNDTKEGKAQNRRIAVNVTRK